MKKAGFIFVLFICTFSVQGQNKNDISIEIDTHYLHYFMGENNQNNFNYGYSFLVSASKAGVKVSSGVNYATQDYHYKLNPPSWSDQLNERQFSLRYFNIPFLINAEVKQFKKTSLSILSGLILNKLVSYDMVSFYADHPPLKESVKVPAAPGLSAKLGIQFTRKINQKMNINLAAYSNAVLVVANQNGSSNSYRSIPLNRLSWGINLGFEYKLKQKTSRKP
jgi:hypothetical protein